MATRTQQLRDTNPDWAPGPIDPGELAVSPNDLQLFVGMFSNSPAKALIAARYFDRMASYDEGELIYHQDKLLRCNAAGGLAPKPFDVTDWEGIDFSRVPSWLVGPWRALAYPVNSVVTHDDGLWINLNQAADPADIPGVPPPPGGTPVWTHLDYKGSQDAIDAINASLAVKNFDPTANYAQNDLVAHLGLIYRALVQVPPGPWDANSWQDISESEISIGSTAPQSPKNGALWWDDQSGETFIYYVGPRGNQWMSIVYGLPAGVQLDPPPTPANGNVYSVVAGIEYTWDANRGVWTVENTTVLKKSGGTMTGAILLPGVAPTRPNEAVGKNYVDQSWLNNMLVGDTPPADTVGRDGQVYFVRV